MKQVRLEPIKGTPGRSQASAGFGSLARLRAIHLKHWKRGRTIYRELRSRDLSDANARRVAANGRCWWKDSGMLIHVAFPIRYFDELGVPRLAA